MEASEGEEKFPHHGSMFQALFHTMGTCFARVFRGVGKSRPADLWGDGGAYGGVGGMELQSGKGWGMKEARKQERGRR